MPGFLDQTVKPHRITATFYSHNRRPRQLRVKPTHVVVLVIEFPLMQLPIARVHPAHHLRADMQVHSEVKCSHLCLLARARPANLAPPRWLEPTPLTGDTQEPRPPATKNHPPENLYNPQPTQKIPPPRPAAMAYTANLLLRTLPAIARDNGLQPQQQGPIFDYSDWPDPQDGSGIRGPACHRRAVLAGALRDQEKTSS